MYLIKGFLSSFTCHMQKCGVILLKEKQNHSGRTNLSKQPLNAEEICLKPDTSGLHKITRGQGQFILSGVLLQVTKQTREERKCSFHKHQTSKVWQRHVESQHGVAVFRTAVRHCAKRYTAATHLTQAWRFVGRLSEKLKYKPVCYFLHSVLVCRNIVRQDILISN